MIGPLESFMNSPDDQIEMEHVPNRWKTKLKDSTVDYLKQLSSLLGEFVQLRARRAVRFDLKLHKAPIPNSIPYNTYNTKGKFHEETGHHSVQ